MPLKTGKGSIRANVQELMMNRIQSPSRKKGIATIARRRNISRADARWTQSLAIAKSQARKK